MTSDVRLRHLIYPLLPYRSYFYPILVLVAIAGPCWLVFRLYRRRTPEHRLPFYREVLLLTFIVYLVGLAVATLTPNQSSRLTAEGRGGIDFRPNRASLTCSSAILPTGSSARGFCMHNFRANLALLFPLGILLPLVWTRLRFWSGILIAVALSLSIELVQYLSSSWGSYRAADINDVILNVLGAFLGLAVVFLLRLSRSTRAAVARS